MTTTSRYSSYNCLNGWDSYDKIPRVRVEYYVNENTFKEKLQLYFIRNQRSSLRIRIANLILRLMTCILYIIRVLNNPDPIYAACYDCTSDNKTDIFLSRKLTEEKFQENPVINWNAIIWVHRPFEIWFIQVVLSMISLTQTILLVYLEYKGSSWSQLFSFQTILELITTIPFIIMIFWPSLRNLFVPVFLNCWIAKYALQNMFNDLHRALQKSQSALSQQLTILTATLLCLVFTSVCGIQHFQRAGHRNMSLFQATYFVVVTFSTVGYGDLVPDIWPSQLFMVLMICAALIVIPTQFEQLAFTWMEKQKLGSSYSAHRSHCEKHVVVCSTNLHADTIMDFLNEFYAHPLLKDYFVVLLSPMELDTTMRMILHVPMWAQHVIYVQGSCLKDIDLSRARMYEAEACFILADRNYADKTAADEHTILRSWAVKDFAPDVPQYVQIFRPENKLHVKFAEHVVCEDELKYALLANNCTCPGASTLVTLLLHTSRGQEGQQSNEEWHRLYGRCSGNEVYHITLRDSRFFGEYEGKSFTYASFHSHKKYGVALVGVRPIDLPEFYEDTILLNPGPKHIMRSSDICYYMSITKEENSSFAAGDQITEKNTLFPIKAKHKTPDLVNEPLNHKDDGTSLPKIVLQVPCCVNTLSNKQKETTPNYLNVPKTSGEVNNATETFLNPESLNRRESRRLSILPVPDKFSSSTTLNLYGDQQSETAEESDDEIEDEICLSSPSEKIGIVKGFPPVSPYIGVSPTLCFLLKEKKPMCCLQLTQACDHCSYRHARDYKWKNKTIILAADYASSGIYNFIIPLRAHFHTKTSLNPIILLLERRPNIAFLDSISYFPLIYWMQGSIDSLDDLLRAGINLAKNVVVVNKELSNSAEEDNLADCNTIISVQTIFKFFPSINCITELSHSSNMKFMQFQAKDKYALHLSKMEKKEKERGSHISYMFRLPFAAGSVFSANMLDTLLYQAFVKDYVITFVRLLLGVDQAPGSGFLTSMKITKEDMWIRTYGRLYQKLCSTTCEIPLGIYRTIDTTASSNSIYSYDDCKSERIGVTYKPKIGANFRTCFEVDKSIFSMMTSDGAKDNHELQIERAEIANLVRSRMECLNLLQSDYTDISEKRNSLSFVIINPSCDLKLEEGDLIYIIRPSPFSTKKTFERHNSRRKSTISFCSQIGNNNFSPYKYGSTLGLVGKYSERNPSIGNISKTNSNSLPESPMSTYETINRARSNSLKLLDDILLRRSSLLCSDIRRKCSLENDCGDITQFSTIVDNSSIKISLNNDIGLEVTPPQDCSTKSFTIASQPMLNVLQNRGHSMINLSRKSSLLTSSHQQLFYDSDSKQNSGTTNSLSPTMNTSPSLCNLKGTIV